jgi:cell division protein FtsQ
MPLDLQDPEGDESPRFGGAPSPWWRPGSTVGRVFLGLGALVILGGIATSIFLFKTYLGRDSRFRIAGADNIAASGLTEVSRQEMLPVFGEDIGRNIFFVPLAERRKELEALPWVEHATVMRMLPDQIRVAVVERQPVAFTRQGQEVGLVDASGVLLSMPAAMMAQRHYSFPVVTGLDSHDTALGRKARMAVYGRLMAELDSGGQNISAQISEIDLTDLDDAKVTMPEPGADILAHFGGDRFQERYQRYKAHIGEWRQQYPKLAAVDLRYDQQVVLEMAPGSSAVQENVGESAPSQAGEKAPSGQTAETGKSPAASSPAPTPAAKAPVHSSGSDIKNQAQAHPAGHDTKAKKTNAGLKQSASAASKHKAAEAKARATKAKATKEKKKRAEIKGAALNASKRKPSATIHPAEATAQGQ